MIDSHHHLWNYDPLRHNWIDDSMERIKHDFTGQSITSLASSQGVAGTVLIQVDQTEAETLWLLDQAEKYEIIKAVVGWVDLRADNVEERLAYFKKFKQLKGFRHIAQAEPNDFLTGKAFQRGIASLHDFGYSYDVLVYHYQLPAVVELVDAFPNQKFVIDHLAKPDIKQGLIDQWAKHMEHLSKRPNVCCKLSGMITEADHDNWDYQHLVPYMDVVLEHFGPERLMFGSDWPVCLLAGAYDQVLGVVKKYVSELSEVEQSYIMSENASNFYEL